MMAPCSVKKIGGAKPGATSPQKLIEGKWGKALATAGWTAIPNAIIENQGKLGLDALDLAILLQVAACWWSADRPPFPGRERIASNIGVTPRTVQRRLVRLAKVGLISKVARHSASGRQKSNEYGFKGLIAKATPYADKMVAAKRAKKPAGKPAA